MPWGSGKTNGKSGHKSIKYGAFALVIIICVSCAWLFVQQPRTPSPETQNSLASILADITQHADPLLRMQRVDEADQIQSYWLVNGGYMVGVRDLYALTSSSDDRDPEDERLVAAEQALSGYAARQFRSAGYLVDAIDSSTSSESDPFYTKRTAFLSPDDTYRCVIESYDESVPPWVGVDCVAEKDISGALKEQTPFIKALGDIKGMAAIPREEGSFAVVNATNGLVGAYFALLNKTTAGWHVIYHGQQPPSCTLMRRYSVPPTIYQKCI